MNDAEGKKLKFDILGYTVAFNTQSKEGSIDPQKIVDYVREEAALIMGHSEPLDPGQVAVLLALKLAKENLELKTDIKDNLDKLHVSANDALRYFDEVMPTNN
jgi:hypothetical protein